MRNWVLEKTKYVISTQSKCTSVLLSGSQTLSQATISSSWLSHTPLWSDPPSQHVIAMYATSKKQMELQKQHATVARRQNQILHLKTYMLMSQIQLCFTKLYIWSSSSLNFFGTASEMQPQNPLHFLEKRVSRLVMEKKYFHFWSSTVSNEQIIWLHYIILCFSWQNV